MVRTFDDEVKALEDYGHDCCARIDDRIHECCKRIREAHRHDVGEAFKIGASWKEVKDAVDAGGRDEAGSGDTSASSPQCACGGRCGGLAEEVAPITTELRDSMAYVTNTFSGDDEVRMDEEEFDRLCDNIDAIHAGLERDYKVACDVNEHQDLEYADLAKRYDKTITLPLDADGLPIRVGDVVRLTESWRDFTVLGIGIVDAHERRWGVFVREGNDYVWYNAEFLHHHVPTVEDVLLEACKAYHGLMVEGMSDVAHDMPAPSEVIAEYAAKLKLADA